jgi:hypothetical protein
MTLIIVSEMGVVKHLENFTRMPQSDLRTETHEKKRARLLTMPYLTESLPGRMHLIRAISN